MPETMTLNSSTEPQGMTVDISANAGPINQLGTTNAPPGLDVEQEKLFNFGEARVYLQRLINDWDIEVKDTDTRRRTRDVEVDTESLRNRGELDEDETIIPVRVIDVNIQREQPSYCNYLKNSRRICTFRSLTNPQQDTQLIEKEFTEGMTYTGWETPHFKRIDGAQTHGWATLEIEFDESKPLHVAMNYVAHDELFFPRSTKHIQDAPRVVRAYDVTVTILRSWVREFGFDSNQVDLILASRKDNQKEAETFRIYKLFFKKEGIVYVGWFTLLNGATDWLKAPAKLFLGISHKQTVMVPQPSPLMPGQMIPTPVEQWVDSDVTFYPLSVLPYKETEKPKIADVKGRVFMDENKQEAQTAVLSGFVNGLTRASNIFASPGQDDGSGSSLKELEDIQLKGGRILSKPIEFWHPDYPDPMVLRSLQYFDQANSEEVGQVNFASMNREDSRKTAKEITSAEQQQNLLNSVQLTNFSTAIRAEYSFAWLIVQSQALQGKIKFLQINQPMPAINPMTGQPQIDPQTGQPIMQDNWVNDIKTIEQIYELRAAGDVDVIQRQEKTQMMMQDWPVIANTPLAGRFLQDLMKLKYPDVGEQYAAILGQANPANLVGALSTIMQGVLKQHPEIMQEIGPQEQQILTQVMQQAQQLTQQNGQTNKPQPQQQSNTQ